MLDGAVGADSSMAKGLVDVVEIHANAMYRSFDTQALGAAFAAVKRDRTVVTWGGASSMVRNSLACKQHRACTCTLLP